MKTKRTQEGTPEFDRENKEILDLWSQGLLVNEVANKLGYSKDVIKRRLDCLGISNEERFKRRGEKSKIRELNKRNDISTEEIIRLYFEDKMGCPDIAKKLGCSITIPQQRIINAGYKLRSASEAHKLKPAKYWLNKHCPNANSEGHKKAMKEWWNDNKDGEKGKNILSNLGGPNNSGEKNYCWQGGKSFEPYSPEFNTNFKNQIRKRDNQVCMNCGIHREKLNQSFSIHHVNYEKELSINENCISLCNKCHSLTNHNREYWIKFFQEKLDKLYNYKYDNKGNVIINIGEQKNEK